MLSTEKPVNSQANPNKVFWRVISNCQEKRLKGDGATGRVVGNREKGVSGTSQLILGFGHGVKGPVQAPRKKGAINIFRAGEGLYRRDTPEVYVH